MAYWIFENGETVGPLTRANILERAGQETFVSHGQEWVRLKQHPDFSDQVMQPPASGTTGSPSFSQEGVQPLPQGFSTNSGPSADTILSSESPFGDISIQSRAAVEPLEQAHGVNRNRVSGSRDGSAATVRGESAITPNVHARTMPTSKQPRSRWILQGSIAVLFLACVVAILLHIVSPSSSENLTLDAGRAGDSTNATGLPSSDSTTFEAQVLGSIDEKIAARQEKLQEIQAALQPLQIDHYTLARQYPTFQVSGEILDRGEDGVLIFGTAIPSNQDQGHLGTVVRPGNIEVHNVENFQSALYFSHDSVYFIEKTTGQNAHGATVPVRFYSTQPPPDYHDAERKMSKLRARIEPLFAQIGPLETEINALLEEKNLKIQQAAARRQQELEDQQRQQLQAEWEAIENSAWDLQAYAQDKWESGNLEATERACGRWEELGSIDPEFLYFCAEVSEGAGDATKAILRYEEVLKYSPSHAAANRKLAYVRSRDQSDPFEEARFLKTYLDHADGTEPEYDEVESRFVKLTSSWGNEARRICLDIDQARTDLPSLILMERYTHRSTVEGNIRRNEAIISTGKTQLLSLNNQLSNVGLDLDEIFRDYANDRSYWDKRRRQASNLRSMIKQEEQSAKTAYREGEAQYRWQNVSLYMTILGEIEDEARDAGVSL